MYLMSNTWGVAAQISRAGAHCTSVAVPVKEFLALYVLQAQLPAAVSEMSLHSSEHERAREIKPISVVIQFKPSCWYHLVFSFILMYGNIQGSTLLKITRNPKVSNYEIQGTQHKAYMKKNKFIWSPKSKSQSPEAPGRPQSTALIYNNEKSKITAAACTNIKRRPVRVSSDKQHGQKSSNNTQMKQRQTTLESNEFLMVTIS